MVDNKGKRKNKKVEGLMAVYLMPWRYDILDRGGTDKKQKVEEGQLESRTMEESRRESKSITNAS